MTDQRLHKAYKSTLYIVDDPLLGHDAVPIKIGRKHPDLDALIIPAGSWAFITAYNPQSERTSEELNIEQNNKLKKRINALNFPNYSGYSEAPDGTWREAAFLVLDIDKMQALKLARQFKQKAFVFGQKGSEAQLVYC